MFNGQLIRGDIWLAARGLRQRG